MNTFLLVGLSFHTFRDYLVAEGHDYIELRDKAKTKHPDKQFKRRHVCDFSSVKTMLADVDKVAQKHHFDGVLAMYENYVLPAAYIAKHLGLPGMPIDSAEACTDKFTMRQCFARSSEKISPDYAIVKSEAELVNFANSHDLPLILKPANLAKSLLVTKSNSLEELLANYHRTMGKIDKVYQKYAPNRQPKLLVEEFMEGSIHSVDAFIDTTGKPHILEQVVDYQTGYDVGFDDNFHYSRLLPTKLPADTIAAIRRTAVIGCQALGMKNSSAHIEIILTSGGPRIVEIGARNGGYRERMHKMANGIDIIGNSFRVAAGKAPSLVNSRNDPCAVLELFPKHAGLFQGISNEQTLSTLPSLTYLDVKANVGDYVGKSADGYKMCAVIMLHSTNKRQFDRDLDFVRNQVHVLTKV